MLYVSPSQIATWLQCKRRWAYSRQRPRGPSNKWAVFGTDAHGHLERWVRDGVPPDTRTAEGRCALAGLELVPLPGHGLVEHAADMEHDGVVYRFRVDLIHGFESGRIVCVDDHKTIGDLANAKDEHQLRLDPQRIIYARWAAHAFNVPYVACKWNYLRRNPPGARPVTIVQHRDTIEELFLALHRDTVIPIVQAHGVDPNQFERTYSYLCRYCDHQEECFSGLSVSDRAAAATYQIRKR